ncbi:MAG: methyltransferase domain-containing protein [Variovorax sp.]|nr:MAG: methyltransferase domain-containing protein [Variovorax sp.]
MRRSCFALVLAGAFGTSAFAQTAALVEEVPYITTPDNVTLEMLRIADVKAGDHVIDLGSGDGRIVVTAAKRFGATGLGVEIVPDLVRQSIDNARRAGVAERATFRQQDIFETDLSAATVVTLYLLPEFNLRLRPALLALKPGTRIVSHDWDMGDWPPDRTVALDVPDKKIGREKRSSVHLWRVPAPVQGLWCAGAAPLRVQQSFQAYRALLGAESAGPSWTGTIDGVSLLPPAGGPPRPSLRWEADGTLVATTGATGLATGTRFRRSTAGRCDG